MSLDLGAIGAEAVQSTSYGANYTPEKALDGDPSTFTHTDKTTAGNFWKLNLKKFYPITRVEIQNRNNVADRMGGLVFKVLDATGQTIVSEEMENPGAGGIWTFSPTTPIAGQTIWVGLEGSDQNDAGDYVVSLAEIRVFVSAPNIALEKESYMVRLTDSLPPTSNGNDDDLNTYAETSSRTVDGYWEVDLAETYALSSVRILVPDYFTNRMIHATLHLFDGKHESVWRKHLSTTPSSIFEIFPDGVRCARYVRVGYELKERSSPEGKTRWHLGLSEMQVYGELAQNIGIQSFSKTANQLSWDSYKIKNLTIYPDIGSVDSVTDPDGTGAVAIQPTQSTCYTLLGTNECGVFAQSTTVTVNGEVLPLRINEFMVKNNLTLKDGYKKASDWIEIFNPANTPVNLEGYALSDNLAKPRKWVFPAYQLPAHSYLIVFASGDDSVDPDGFLHANFKLDENESVILSRPDGTIIDRVENMPEQKKDLAYGRQLNGQGWAFVEPTPQKVNYAPAYEGWLKTPEFSQTRGFYTQPFSLSISNRTDGATVLYSGNGATPSFAYTHPLSITGTQTIRAYATRPGYKASRIKTHSYIFIEDVVRSSVLEKPDIARNYSTRIREGLLELPTLCISAPLIPDDYTEEPASVEIIWPNGQHRDLQENCGIVRFGNAFSRFSKRQYRLKFRTKYGAPKLKAKLFEGFDHGFPVKNEFNQLDVRSGSQDMKSRGFYMSNRFADDSMLDMGSLNPHGRFVHLYINGQYWGQYHLRERLTDHFLGSYLPGKTSDFYIVKGNDNIERSFAMGTPDPLFRHQWETVRSHTGNYQQLKNYVDIDGLIDFMLLWFYGDSESEFRSAGSVNAGSGFKYWMADADGFLRSTTKDKTVTKGPSNFFDSLVREKNPEFMTRLADRIYKHFFNDGALTPAANTERLNQRMAEIHNSLIAECARWGNRTPTNWEEKAQEARDTLFPNRGNVLLSQLRKREFYPAFDPPIFVQHGGIVPSGYQPTLHTPSGTIYYTLDGSDPRLPGGGISPKAQIYSSSTVQIQDLIQQGSLWKYMDNGSNQGTAWYSMSFNDSTWATGNALLGYGNGGETTVLDYGSNSRNKYTTTYFRHTFQLNDLAQIQQLKLRLLRDDGAVVYLNGTEILRNNMPNGAINYQTFASSAVVGSDETTFWDFALPLNTLRQGENLLAVELHQSSLTSSDIGFDLALQATLSAPPSTNSITLTNDTLFSTRVLLNGKWSALSEAQFLMQAREPVACSNTVITEIHYNPDGSDDTEFIELYNTSPSNIVDFTQAQFNQGIRFFFPNGQGLEPNSFGVIVEDLAAFSNRYQNINSPWYFPNIHVLGQWTGSLSDRGETLALIASNGTVVASAHYKTGLDWPTRANGKGSSIELRKPEDCPPQFAEATMFYANPFSWRSSHGVHGSPGRFDIDSRKIVINELLSHTDADIDWIELQNQGSQAVNLGGLYLGDHSAHPLRFVIPSNTVLQAGDFIRFNTNDFHFGFSELGSEALLTEAAGTNLVRFLDTVDFPAAEREIPFGRYRKSDGTIDFTELAFSTPLETNAAPRIGSVVISEILYQPAPDKSEFIELVNRSAHSINLFDPTNPTNCWHLSGAVDYSFPQGQSLAAGEVLVICATNPATFRTQYGLDNSIRVYGPWVGSLDNAGEHIKLRYPGDPEPLTGFVPYYRIDHVNYRPFSPWPVAATNAGTSLVRIPLGGYGNDPATWRELSIPAPGTTVNNYPPTLNFIPDMRHPAAVEFSYSSTAFDPDLPAQPLVFSATGLPAGISIDPQTGVISGIGTQSGIYPITVTVSDSQHPPLSATRAFTLELTQPFVLTMTHDHSSANGLYLSIPTLTGEEYWLETRPTLTAGQWKLQMQIRANSEQEDVFIDSQSSTNAIQFYRVRWIRP